MKIRDSPFGALYSDADDIPNRVAGRTIALVGFLGGERWAAFTSSSEAVDGEPDPLDRWPFRLISVIAREMGAEPLFPFSGPPWLSFQRWA